MEEDDYRDSFASLDEHEHYLHGSEEDKHSDTAIPHDEMQHTTSSAAVDLSKPNVLTFQAEPLQDIQYYQHNESNKKSTQKRVPLESLESLEDERDIEMELHDVELASPPEFIHPSEQFGSASRVVGAQLKMVDDHGHHDALHADTVSDKHKSVWSDLALQFLKGEMVDDFLTFDEDSVASSPEVLLFISQNKSAVSRRKWLWRIFAGGWLFTVLYTLGACFIFLLFGCCFALPSTIQLIRLGKFMWFPFTKIEIYQYLIKKLNEGDGIELTLENGDLRRMSTASLKDPKKISVKEHREAIFKRADKSGVLLWLANITWLVLFGWWISLLHLIMAGILMASVVGTIFGRRHLAFVTLSLMPFGVSIKK